MSCVVLCLYAPNGVWLNLDISNPVRGEAFTFFGRYFYKVRSGTTTQAILSIATLLGIGLLIATGVGLLILLGYIIVIRKYYLVCVSNCFLKRNSFCIKWFSLPPEHTSRDK
jgi:hypothetical protein